MGIYASVESSFDGTSGETTYFYDGPGAPFGGWTYSTASYSSGASIEIRVPDVELWAKLTGALLRLAWTEVQIYIDGSYHTTLSGAVDAVSAGTGPNYVPIVGIPAQLSGGVGAGKSPEAPTYDPCDPSADVLSYSWDMTGGPEGGWSFEETGSGTRIPLSVTLLSAASGGVVGAGDTNSATISARDAFSSDRTYVGRETATCTVTYDCVNNATEEEITVTVSGSPFMTDPCTMELVPLARDVYKTLTTGHTKGGTVLLQPDLSSDLIRMQPDYRSQMYRSQLPETRSYAVSVEVTDSVTVTTPTTTTIHPATSQFRGSVGDSANPIEDYLALASYAPSEFSTGETDSETYDFHYPAPVAFCDPSSAPPEAGDPHWTCAVGSSIIWPTHTDHSHSLDESGVFPSFVGMGDGVGGDYQWHLNDLARYLGYWGNKLWHLWHFFPSAGVDDDGLPLPQSAWELDGGAVSNLYWKLGRAQWAGDTYLPTLDKTKHRSDLISGPVEESGHTPFQDAFCGDGLRWPGGSRWPVMDCGTGATGPYEDCPVALELTSSSASAWSITGATISHGGTGMTLTPDGSGDPIHLTLNLAQWACPPFLYPSVSESVTPSWVSTGIASVDAKFVSALGGTSTTTGVSSGSPVSFPRATDSGYAGSWAIENGVPDPAGGNFTSDLGVDQAPGGDSIATMADPSRVQSFDGLQGRGASELTLIITLSGTPATVLVHYPTFNKASGTPMVVWESGQCCAIIYTDGPGIRFGNWVFYDPGSGFQNPPEIAGSGYKSTIVDGICMRRSVYQGVDPLTGGTSGTVASPITIPALTTELATRYDTYEGQSIAVVDKFGISYPLPVLADGRVRIALTNTMAELPPFSCFPVRKRSTTTWEANGTFHAGEYDLCQEPRYTISAGSPLFVEKPDSTVVSSSASSISGWELQKYAVALDNDEGTDWQLTADGILFAKVRPFRGWFWLGFPGGSQNPHLVQDPSGRIYLAYGRNGTIRAKRAGNGYPDPWEHDSMIDAGPGDFRPRLAYDFSGGDLLCGYERVGHCYLRISRDGGRTWRDEIDMGYGYRPEPASSHTKGLVYFRLENVGGTPLEFQIYVRHQTDAADLVWSSETLVTDQDGNPISCELEGWGGVTAPWSISGGWLMAIVPYSETDPVTFLSRERKALTFKRI